MNYVPNTDHDRSIMLNKIGVTSVDELFHDLPAELRHPRLGIPAPLSEIELTRLAVELAGNNVGTHQYACFLGAGAYNHFIPSIVRHVTGRSEFFTSYTPYQAEASQGTLQSIFEFQSLVCQLMGMDVANASMYDGASASAEAAVLAHHATRRSKVLVAPTVHPDYLSVIRTYTRELGLLVETRWDFEGSINTGRSNPSSLAQAIDGDTACVVVQHPNFFGCLEDVESLAQATHGAGALLVMIVDPISLGILKPPGAYSADIAVAEGQSLGNPLNFGGPFVGLFAAKQQFLRLVPGRIVGQAYDSQGRRGFVLTLQAREQHIRREKATSNICTNEALNALAALVYLSSMGKQGLRRVAEICLQKSHYAADRIKSLKQYELAYSRPFFKEFVVRCPRPPAEINRYLLEHSIIGGYDLGGYDRQLGDCMLFCVTEMNTRDEIDRLIQLLGDVK